MKHYSLAVFTKKDGASLEDLLNIYDDKLVVDKYIQYTKNDAIIHVKAQIENYKNSIYADYMQNPEEYAQDNNDEQHLKYLTEEFPKKLLWTDEECYEDIKANYSEDMIDEDGNLYSIHNPKSKWMSYDIGGEFSGKIKLIDGSCVNSAKVKNAILENNNEVYEQALLTWEIIVEGKEIDDEASLIDVYNFNPDYYLETYGNKEDFALFESQWITNAVLMPDGEWYEAESSFGEKYNLWKKEYEDRFINAADPEWTLTIVDCCM